MSLRIITSGSGDDGDEWTLTEILEVPEGFDWDKEARTYSDSFKTCKDQADEIKRLKSGPSHDPAAQLFIDHVKQDLGFKSLDYEETNIY